VDFLPTYTNMLLFQGFKLLVLLSFCQYN